MKKLLAIFLCLNSTMSLACEAQVAESDIGVAALSISMTSLEVTLDEGRRSVASLGTIKNSAPSCFDEVVVEAKYFDANKKHIDTVVQRLYGVVVPARGEVSFRIYDGAAKPKGEYSEQQVRVLDAETRGSRRGNKAGNDTFKELLVSWGPMVLLISVWIFFMRKMRDKNSPQERSLALMQQQLSMAEQQHKELSRIAAAIENAVGSKHDS